ncbi:MAG: MFS transporter [Myxococcales bacterium]|nr:MFS transporter [Myxococcales bacterium]MCA9696113.1 MFS transporter [Myxococcales bacterium]
MATPSPRHPLAWVPTAYLAEGIPYAMVIWVAGTLFKDLGHSDSAITVGLGSIAIAWSLKPFWAAFLDMFRSKRFFVLTMELLLALLLGLIALALPLPSYFQIIIAILWVLAFASATQDICVDGIYVTSLDPAMQARYIGVQGMAWNVGRIFATALVVWVAGTLQADGGYAPKLAWAIAIGLSAAAMAALALYHMAMLPPGSRTTTASSSAEVVATFLDTLRDFFRKDAIWGMLAFVFLFRSAEGLLLVEAPLFLQAPLEDGGLGLTLIQKGVIDGTISTAAAIGGGLLGGVFVSRYGLKRTLFFLALCVNVPNLCYVYLAWAVGPDAPLSMTTITLLVTIEKFGYNFGFVANMLYMMQQISPGRYQMTHYAFCTALMNLVLIPTQMASGPLADWMGYRVYFVFVIVATIPSLVVAKIAPFPRSELAEESPPS